jgi:SAM-dependent methyltransferase
MRFKDHFSRLSTAYSEYRPTYPAALFDYLAHRCPSRGRVWDCACGSGQATLALARHFDSVIATDASAQQIAAALASDNVSYRVARAEDSGIETGSVDLVTVAQALHWCDLDSFYCEVHRVLTPSGIIAVWTYGALHLDDPRTEALIREFYHDIVGPYWPPERKIVENGYRDLPFPFSELAPPAFDMEADWDLPRLLGYLRTWSATSRYVEEKHVDPVAALGERLASGLAACDQSGPKGRMR